MSGYDKIKAIIVHKYGKPPAEMDDGELIEAHSNAACDCRFAKRGINAYVDEKGETYYEEDGIKKSQKEIDILEVVFLTLDLFMFTSFDSENQVASVIEETLAEKGLK